MKVAKAVAKLTVVAAAMVMEVVGMVVVVMVMENDNAQIEEVESGEMGVNNNYVTPLVEEVVNK